MGKKIIILLGILLNIPAIFAQHPEIGEGKPLTEADVNAVYSKVKTEFEKYQKERLIAKRDITEPIKDLARNNQLLNLALEKSHDISSDLKDQIESLMTEINSNLNKAKQALVMKEAIEQAMQEPIDFDKKLGDIKEEMQRSLELEQVEHKRVTMDLPDVLEDIEKIKEFKKEWLKDGTLNTEKILDNEDTFLKDSEALDQRFLDDATKAALIEFANFKEFKKEWLKNGTLNTEKIQNQETAFLLASKELDSRFLDDATKKALIEFANFMETRGAKIKTNSALIKNIDRRMKFLEQQYQILKDKGALKNVVTNVVKDIFRLLPQEGEKIVSAEIKLKQIDTFLKKLDVLTQANPELLKSMLSEDAVSQQIKKLQELAIYKESKRFLKPAYEIFNFLKKYQSTIQIDVDKIRNKIEHLKLLKKRAENLSLDKLSENINKRIELLKEGFTDFRESTRISFAQGILSDIFRGLPERKAPPTKIGGFEAEPLRRGEEVELEEIEARPTNKDKLDLMDKQLESFKKFIEEVQLTKSQKKGIFSKIDSQAAQLKDFALETTKKNEFEKAYTILKTLEPYDVLPEYVFIQLKNENNKWQES